MTSCPKTTTANTTPIMGPPLPSIAPDVLQQDPTHATSRLLRYRVMLVDASRNHRHRSKISHGSLVNDDGYSSKDPRSRNISPSDIPSRPLAQRRYFAEIPVEQGLFETDLVQIDDPVLATPLHDGQTSQSLTTRDVRDVPSSRALASTRVSPATTFRGSPNFGYEQLSYSGMRPSSPTFWSPVQICLANMMGPVDPALSEYGSVIKTDTAFRVRAFQDGENSQPSTTHRDVRDLLSSRGLGYTKASTQHSAVNVQKNSDKNELLEGSPDFCYDLGFISGRFPSRIHDVVADLLVLKKEVEPASWQDQDGKGNSASPIGWFPFGQAMALTSI